MDKSPPSRDITDDLLPTPPLLPDHVISEEVMPPPLSAHRGAPALVVAAADKAAAGGCRPPGPVGRDLLSSLPAVILLCPPVDSCSPALEREQRLLAAPRRPLPSPRAHAHSLLLSVRLSGAS